MSAEHRAILLLLALATAGQGVRYLLLRPGGAPGAVEILADSRPGAPLAHRDSAVHLARPLAAGEAIDANRAPAAELARLPRVGPGLARAIVAYREAHGPFGGLAGLDSVPGVGPALLASLGPHLRFTGAARASGPRSAGAAPVGAGGVSAGPLDLNTATTAQLQSLPGIGPAKAQRIVRFRDSVGGFGSVRELGRVPGIGPALLSRLQNLAVVR